MPQPSRSSSASGARTSAGRRAKTAAGSSGSATFASRLRKKAFKAGSKPEAWVFHRKRSGAAEGLRRPRRDSLGHQDEGCEFPGLGPHSLPRATITWGPEACGSAIEASKIAGHADLEMTGEYTFVPPERRNELTRHVQKKLANAGAKATAEPAPPPPQPATTPEVPPTLVNAARVTPLVQ